MACTLNIEDRQRTGACLKSREITLPRQPTKPNFLLVKKFNNDFQSLSKEDLCWCNFDIMLQMADENCYLSNKKYCCVLLFGFITSYKRTQVFIILIIQIQFKTERVGFCKAQITNNLRKGNN